MAIHSSVQASNTNNSRRHPSALWKSQDNRDPVAQSSDSLRHTPLFQLSRPFRLTSPILYFEVLDSLTNQLQEPKSLVQVLILENPKSSQFLKKKKSKYLLFAETHVSLGVLLPFCKCPY